MTVIIGERAKRARHSQVCTIENWGYIIARAISVYSAGVPYAARFTAAIKSRYPWLRFSSRIRFDRKLSESYFVGLWIKQKSIELQKKRLKSAEERARARASSACAQTR